MLKVHYGFMNVLVVELLFQTAISMTFFTVRPVVSSTNSIQKGIIMQNVSTRARFVANIFDILAWVVLGLGAFSAVSLLVVGIANDNLGEGFAWAFGISVYTAVAWASISLASIVAGYIEHKS